MEKPPPIKQRTEIFRRVLRLLLTKPETALQKIIDTDAHSGPSSLAPLSDAIRSVGEQMNNPAASYGVSQNSAI